MDNPFTALISDIGQTLAGLRQNAFSSVQNPFGGNMSFGGGQNPFGGGSPFQAQQPFQGNTWRIGNIGGGFQVSNPFGGQNPFNVSNFQQTSSAQTSTASASGQANTQLVGNATAQTVDQWIAQTRPNSPLKGQGAFIVQTAQQFGVPVPVILGIMMQESQLGADGSALPQQNNFTGLTGTGWQGQTGTTQGMARAFATFATPQDGIRAAIENFAKNYQGLTVRQAVSKWLTGDPNGSGDEQGNSVNDYLRTMQTVFQAFGVQWNPDAVPTLANTQARGGGTNGSLRQIWGGGNASITQDFGHTDFAAANSGIYDYETQFGMTPGQHTGLDVGVADGTRLYTPVGGTVIIAGGSGYYKDETGNHDPATSGEVRIRLDNGDELILGHLSNVQVRVGQRINPGDMVGLSGTANGPHVHVEWRVPDSSTPSGWRIVDPRQYLG